MMETKYVYELTYEQKLFINIHRKMSCYGIAKRLNVGRKKVQDYRDKIKI